MRRERFRTCFELTDPEVEMPFVLARYRDDLRSSFITYMVQGGHVVLWPSVVVTEKWTNYGVSLSITCLAYPAEERQNGS